MLQGRSLGIVLLLLALAGFAWGGRPGFESPYPVVYAAVQTVLDPKYTQFQYVDGSAAKILDLESCPDGTGNHCIRPTQPGDVALYTAATAPRTADAEKGSVAAHLRVVPHWHLYLMVAAAILFLIGLPMALSSGERVWASILSEKGGGLSLSRVQLMLWFGGALVVYLSLSIQGGGFVQNVPDQIWWLLGLAGATSTISAGANPTELILTPVEKARARETLEELNELAGHKGPTHDQTVAIRAAEAALKYAGAQTSEPPVVTEARRALADAVRRRGGSLDDAAAASQEEAPTPATVREAEEQLRAYKEALNRPVRQPETQQQVDLAMSFLNRKELDADDTLRAVKAIRQAVDRLDQDLLRGGVNMSKVENRIRKLRGDLGLFDSTEYQVSNVVEDWNGSGDFTRVQYLVLTVAAVGIFLMQFLKTASFPQVPEQFLYMLGASQATYVGVKWMKKPPGTNTANAS